MAKRQIQFTQEQIEILLKNPNVESISSNTIRFTSEFKELAMQKDKELLFASAILSGLCVLTSILTSSIIIFTPLILRFPRTKHLFLLF